MKFSLAFVGAWALATHLAAGVVIERYSEEVVKRRCAGHVTGYDAYPWFRPLAIAGWPLTVLSAPFLEHMELVCDRFD